MSDEAPPPSAKERREAMKKVREAVHLLLRKATASKPLSKEQIAARLVKKFPSLPESLILTQVRGAIGWMLPRDGITVCTSENGHWCE